MSAIASPWPVGSFADDQYIEPPADVIEIAAVDYDPTVLQSIIEMLRSRAQQDDAASQGIPAGHDRHWLKWSASEMRSLADKIETLLDKDCA